MQIVSVTRFKQLNRNRKVVTTGLAVRKQMIGPAETLDNDTRTLRFTISTDCVDRERDKIAISGWELSNYKRNAVVLWGHDPSRLPIGRAFDVAVRDGALKASVEFIPADTPEGGQFAESVYRLARQGFLNATSVGFRPIKWDYTDDPERGADDWFPGIDFDAQELVELSIVTVPANPEALIEDAPAVPGGEVASDLPPTGDDNLDHANMAATIAAMKARRRRVLAWAEATMRNHADPIAAFR
jgi:HK97 family phage prohead protease